MWNIYVFYITTGSTIYLLYRHFLSGINEPEVAGKQQIYYILQIMDI